ncbi:MAG TPA: ParA family protein, partial [Gemmatimonadales bacterium]|nr:ParA family protein [Gemmatimonadales bacterium]
MKLATSNPGTTFLYCTRSHLPADQPFVTCSHKSLYIIDLRQEAQLMAHIVAIANQKGGVGKTTTAVNLAASLALAERRTLLLDADPQGNATSGLGIAKHELDISLYDALVDGRSAREVIMPVAGLPHLSALPATQDLVGAELQLVERAGRESALRKVLDQVESDYEYVIIDCPPSLGLLTLNVLAAAHAVLIPIQCEYYGLEGISQLLNTVRLVQQNFNPGLAISGVLLTMYDARLNLCRQVAEDAKEYFGAKMFVTAIPRNVRLAEAPSFGKPILLYDVQSVGAKSYIAVAQELLRRVENPAGGDGVTKVGAGVASEERQSRSQPSQPAGPQPDRPQSEEPQSEVSRSAGSQSEWSRSEAPQSAASQSEASQSEASQSDDTESEDSQSDDSQSDDSRSRNSVRAASPVPDSEPTDHPLEALAVAVPVPEETSAGPTGGTGSRPASSGEAGSSSRAGDIAPSANARASHGGADAQGHRSAKHRDADADTTIAHDSGQPKLAPTEKNASLEAGTAEARDLEAQNAEAQNA